MQRLFKTFSINIFLRFRGIFRPQRNESISFHSKSIDWFLYDGETGLPNTNAEKILEGIEITKNTGTSKEVLQLMLKFYCF